MTVGLPEWSSGQESTCQCRRHDPWSRKIPHAAEQLSPSTITTEAHALGSATRKATPVSSPQTSTREQPSLASTRESPCTTMKTQQSHRSIKGTKKRKAWQLLLLLLYYCYCYILLLFHVSLGVWNWLVGVNWQIPNLHSRQELSPVLTEKNVTGEGRDKRVTPSLQFCNSFFFLFNR